MAAVSAPECGPRGSVELLSCYLVLLVPIFLRPAFFALFGGFGKLFFFLLRIKLFPESEEKSAFLSGFRPQIQNQRTFSSSRSGLLKFRTRGKIRFSFWLSTPNPEPEDFLELSFWTPHVPDLVQNNPGPRCVVSVC